MPACKKTGGVWDPNNTGVHCVRVRNWSLITGRGGSYKTGGGGCEVLPLRKGGAEKVLAMLKGGYNKF